MARARNIKPGFFVNPDLIECSPLTRIMFIGLWCIADREGKLEDRPKFIKLNVLPGDTCDCDVMLNELQQAGFIYRYNVDGKRLIKIINFNKHQSPHLKEQPSTLPEPIENKEDWCKYGASPEKEGASPADCGYLIADCGYLKPEKEEALPPLVKDLKNEYAFQGEVVKVKWDVWQKWIDAYPHINVLEHAKGCDKTFAKDKAEGREITGWFFRLPAALAKANLKRQNEIKEAYERGGAIL